MKCIPNSEDLCRERVGRCFLKKVFLKLKEDIDVKNRLLDSMGEGKGGMI